jgi:ATP-binding cassette subfamily B protein
MVLKTREEKKQGSQQFSLRNVWEGLAGVPRVLRLVWSASPLLTSCLAGLTALRGITPLITITISRVILDNVILAIYHTHSITPILFPVLLQVIINLLDRICGVFTLSVQQLLQDRTQDTIQLRILQKAEELDLSFYENPDFYDKLCQASGDSMDKPIYMVFQAFSLGRTIITIIAMFGLLFQLAWWLALLALLMPIPSFIADSHCSYRSFRLARSQSPERRMLQYLVRLMTADDYTKEIKLFNLGNFFIERYKQIAETLYADNRRLAMKRMIIGYGWSMLPVLVNGGIYLYVALQAVLGRITLGGLTQYIQAINQAGLNFQVILDNISGAYENNLFVSTLFEFFDYEPKLTSPAQPLTLQLKSGQKGLEIIFRNVTFTYPGKPEPALKNLSFVIRAGETIAIVGYNGAGKTTLIKLLTRLYDPDTGEILVNGRNIKEYALSELYDHIGVLFQDFVRYHFPARENIGLGRTADIENMPLIKSSAEKSRAVSVIDRLPSGYETTLGKWFDEGVQLSGGEWQKIALARAFMRDAQLMILDEPTSALDAQAEHEIFTCFHELTREKTAIYICHRFSAARMADRIFMFEHGQLIESGTHDELMTHYGRYTELFNLQAKAYL